MTISETTMLRRRARRYARQAHEALDEFERTVRSVHPEFATPTRYGELQAAAIRLADLARDLVRREALVWRAIKTLEKRRA